MLLLQCLVLAGRYIANEIGRDRDNFEFRWPIFIEDYTTSETRLFDRLCIISPSKIRPPIFRQIAYLSKPFILRIHSSKKKEYMEGIYSELLLYFPWNSEKELNGNKVEECLELFNQNNEIIKKNKNAIFPKVHIAKVKIHPISKHIPKFLTYAIKC